MSKRKDLKHSVERLENLKQATILESLESIDLDNEFDLYDTMIHLFAEGKLDDDFSSDVFQDMDQEQIEKMHELARKYISLCFFAGNPDYWIDSVEGLSMNDLDYTCMRIFDNYNFLLEIIKEGNLDVLEKLKDIQKTDLFSGKIIIDYLRNGFEDDKILHDVLNDYVDKDDEFIDLTDIEKAILVLNPEGVLYRNNGIKERISTSELKKSIIKHSDIYGDLDDLSLSELVQELGDTAFYEAILGIYLDYVLNEEESNLEKNATMEGYGK